jgi:hypothetical protein
VAGCTSKVSVARYYDPSTAQFLTRDPLEALTGSPYGYVAGDPPDGSDPSGLCWSPQSLCVYLTQAGESWTATVDTVTGGATRWVRLKLGIDDSYTTSSEAYQATLNLWLGPSCIDGMPVVREEIVPPEEPEAAAAAASEGAAQTVNDILSGKVGSIRRAPLPPGSPSWQDIGDMTLDQIRAAARANQPGFKTILKLLTDSRFNR